MSVVSLAKPPPLCLCISRFRRLGARQDLSQHVVNVPARHIPRILPLLRIAQAALLEADAILPVAEKHNLSVDAFGVTVTGGSGSGGHVALSDAWGTALEPSPVTPTGEETPYQILAGTIKATIESAEGYNAKGVVVAPLSATGNTGEFAIRADVGISTILGD